MIFISSSQLAEVHLGKSLHLKTSWYIIITIIIIIVAVVVVVVVVIIIRNGASSYLSVLSIRYMSFDLNKVLECTVIDTIVDLLTEVVATKMGKSYMTTNLSWIRARLSFALLRSALLCLTLSLPRGLPLTSKIVWR